MLLNMTSFSPLLSSYKLPITGTHPKIHRNPRLLCLHGYRTSAAILKKQLEIWPPSLLDQLDLHFLDAPFHAEGKSNVQRFFDPPYFEWFRFSAEYTDYRNFDECLSFLEDYMLKHGPFDGFLGFSQGAILSAMLPGLQPKGIALKKVPKIKFVIIISGGKFESESVTQKAYSTPIECPSLHFLGERDFLKPLGLKLVESFVEPTTINHHKGHIVPRLDDKALEVMKNFIQRISKTLD